MKELLNDYQIKEKYLVENQKVFAYSKELGTKRELNPCEVRNQLMCQISMAEQERDEAQKIVDLKNDLINDLLRLNNQIAGLGYCALETPIYEKIDGVVVKDENGNPKIKNYTHSTFCKNRED